MLTIRTITIFALITFTLAPTAALAHGDIFFEYAPDAWQTKRYSVISGALPYQLFQPYKNFTMTGFDLWLDNTSESGTITFTFSDSAATVLATKNMTLSSLATVAGGNKFHVDWNAPINLEPNETYSIQIYSTSPGFGLYYVERTTLLEHNRELISEYVYGAARLGQEVQNSTFKFALYEPVSSSPSSPPPEQTEQPPPTSVAVTNARVVSVTDTTALFAWTTNVAADSRVTVRSQLNPLYVVASGYDPTFELEHTVLVTGLNPSTLYFGDVFSATTGELLSTYTISFQTAAVSLNQPPASPPPTSPPPTSPPPTSPPPASPPAPPGSEPPSPGDGSSPQSSGNQISIEPGAGGGSINVSWSAPDTGEPAGGYRIDIFDKNYNLTKQLAAPAGTHDIEVTRLESGPHYAIVYGEDNGTFTKVAPPKDFLLTGNTGAVLNKIILVSLLWIGSAAGYAYWQYKKSKSILPAKDNV